MSIDDDYVYFGEDGEEANVNDVHDDQNIREVRTNSKGIKVRGKDLEWIPASSFGSDTLYKESQIYNELKESFTLKFNRKVRNWRSRKLLSFFDSVLFQLFLLCRS